MSAVAKTTVYLPEVEYRRLKALARARDTTAAALLREAVAEYTAKRAPRRLPRSLGAGRSRHGDIGARADELLKGMGKLR